MRSEPVATRRRVSDLAGETRRWRTPAGVALGALIAIAGLAGCAVAPRPAQRPEITPAADAAGVRRTYDGLDAALWLQSAEEARLLRESTYRAATAALAEALADPERAAFGDGSLATALPAAVILDLDETVLDNSPYNAWLTVRGERFGPASWSVWVEAADAAAVPGALEFVLAAERLGVAVFYVSNRDAPMEAATRRNLAALGFPMADAEDGVLLRGERPEWRSDKSGRYEQVARGHRVLLLVGDDLNDFVPVPATSTVESRRALADPVRERFGRDWFLLPNPVHGSWLRAVTTTASGAESAADETARKRMALQVFAPPPAVSPP